MKTRDVSKLMGAAFALALGAIASTATASDRWSGGVWAANDALDYGQSLSAGNAAFQAELAYKLDNDLYAGVFTTSVHDGADYGQEFHLMAGVEKTLAGGIEVNAFVNHHAFAGTGDFREDGFWEVELDASRAFGPVTAVAALVGEPVDGGGFEGFGFFGLESEIELRHGLSLHSSFGRRMFSEHHDGEADYFLSTTGLAWSHKSGVGLFLGVESISLDNKLHPVVRIGRAF